MDAINQKQITLTIESENEIFMGAYCMWIKSVKGFNPTKHCIKCFDGKYINIKPTHFTQPFKTNTPYTFALDNSPKLTSHLINGEILHYFCIVAQPYNWSLNIHAGFIYSQGDIIERTFKEQKITIENAKEIYFDDSVVKEKYSHLPEEFTTCRNFHFGAYYYG